MATELSTIFGDNFRVADQPRNCQQSFLGFSGANGVICTNHGTRGYPIIITGRWYANGTSYDNAMSNMIASLAAFDTYRERPADTYTHRSQTFSNTVFGPFRKIPGRKGKLYHYLADGRVAVDFVCKMRSLT